jgi:mono/diheme cytochrome c family protein
MTPRTRPGLACLPIACALACFVSAGCVQKMGYEGKLKPMGAKPGQRAESRVAPEGTIARGEIRPSELDRLSRLERMPVAATPELLRRGQTQYRVFCLPCHGPSGLGNGMIVQRGFLPPPPYTDARIIAASDGHIFDVVTQGKGAMYGYGDRIEVDDRWAIVAYVRALQLSQSARARQLEEKDRRALERARGGGGP